MTTAEIATSTPARLPDDGQAPDEMQTPLSRAHRRMHDGGLWHAGQHMGRRWAIGCLVLEITQRCNLNCTLCYFSESSEAIKGRSARGSVSPHRFDPFALWAPTLRPYMLLEDMILLVLAVMLLRATSPGRKPPASIGATIRSEKQ